MTEMAWAIFHEDFRWSRPKSPISWEIAARSAAQTYPHDVIEAAVAAGKAVRADNPNAPKRATTTRKRKNIRRSEK